MRFVILSQSRTGADMLRGLVAGPDHEVVFVAESERLERYLRRKGDSVYRGRFQDRELYRRVLPADLLLVTFRDERRIKSTLAAAGKERRGTPGLVLHFTPLEGLGLEPTGFPWVHFVPFAERLAVSFRAETRLAEAKDRVADLKTIFADAKRILILMQDDPDPDALASGLALRQLLGRNRTSAPLGTFGKVTRPENLAMMKILDLEVRTLTPDDLGEFDRIALVDTQPPHLRQEIGPVDAVIDHHPEQTSYEARFKDVRNQYGATATILTEYLRAAREKIHERLATALLYAIRTDTLLLDRNVTEMDVEAFTHVYPRANLNHIRRIERPELPVSVLDSLAGGLTSARIEERVIFSHLGQVEREDVVPQIAEFCLQVEGVEWSVVSGIFDGELIIAVRNVGFVQAAGSVVKAAFGDLGLAGGHRSMAKAILPVDGLPLPDGGGAPTEDTYRELEERFLAPLREKDEG